MWRGKMLYDLLKWKIVKVVIRNKGIDMKKNFVLVLALGFSALTGCTSGAGEEQPGSTVAKDSRSASLAANDEDGKICKVRAIIGSRFKQKTCMTAEEWENMAYESKKGLDKNTRSKMKND